MTGNVTPLRKPAPTDVPAGTPGPLGCVWTSRIDPATSRPQVRAYDAETGGLVLSVDLKLCAGRLDPYKVARVLAQVIGDCDEGAFDLMLEAGVGDA